jgi:threonine dehydrogenase-like Zn-dependent dehydrogenase
MIDHIFSLEEAEKAFSSAKNPGAVKVLMAF